MPGEHAIGVGFVEQALSAEVAKHTVLNDMLELEPVGRSELAGPWKKASRSWAGANTPSSLFTALMASAFFMPVVLGVYWRRGTKEGAASAMIGGVLATFLWKGFGPETIDPVLPGFLVSAVLMVGVSLITLPSPEEALEPYFPGG